MQESLDHFKAVNDYKTTDNKAYWFLQGETDHNKGGET